MNEPIFKSIFGESWNELPLVFKKHYANRAYTEDKFVVTGKLNVMCKAPLIWIAPLLKRMGQIPAYNEQNVPVTVHFRSDKNSKAFYFNRIFYFKNTKPYAFQSHMLQLHEGEVVEMMQFRLGWKIHYSWNGEKVILSHRGYVFKIFDRLIPLPFTVLIGTGYAEESAIDDNKFNMKTHITHPWWGKIYEYQGQFEVSN